MQSTSIRSESVSETILFMVVFVPFIFKPKYRKTGTKSSGLSIKRTQMQNANKTFDISEPIALRFRDSRADVIRAPSLGYTAPLGFGKAPFCTPSVTCCGLGCATFELCASILPVIIAENATECNSFLKYF